MAFDSFREFLAMGGHAPYVWAAWAVTLALLLMNAFHARIEHRRLLRGLKRRTRREQRRSQAPEGTTISYERGGNTHDT